MSSPRSTAGAVVVALVLGAAYWGWTYKLKPQRAQAAIDAKKPFAGLQAGDTREVLLRKTGSADVLLRRVDGSWRLIKPIQAPADQAAVLALVQALADVSREEIVADKDAELRQYGLDKPSGAATFLPVSAGAKAKVLYFGSDNPTGSYSYAMVDGEPQVFLAWLSAKSAILKDADALRDKAVWDFDAAKVKQLSSTQAGGFTLLRADKGGWTVHSQGHDDPGKASAIEPWLGELGSLKASKVPSEDGKGGSWGLASRDLLSIQLVDGRTLTLREGAKAKDGSGFYASAKPGSPVYLLPESARSSLEKAAKDLSDSQAYQLDPQQVERFEVKRHGTLLTAAKTDGAWAWTPEQKAKGKEFDFNAFLAKFQGATILKRLTPSAKPDKVDSGVYFYGSGGTLLESAEFGPKRDGGVLSVSGSKRNVVVVADNLLDGLPPGLTQTAK